MSDWISNTNEIFVDAISNWINANDLSSIHVFDHSEEFALGGPYQFRSVSIRLNSTTPIFLPTTQGLLWITDCLYEQDLIQSKVWLEHVLYADAGYIFSQFFIFWCGGSRKQIQKKPRYIFFSQPGKSRPGRKRTLGYKREAP